MIRSFLLLLALLACASVGAQDAPKKKRATAPEGPRALVFEPESDRPTEGYLHMTVEVPWRVRNTGDRPIRILDIAPRHGAGSGRAEPTLLAPGASGRIVLRRQLTDLGYKEHAFRVRTDDPAGADYPLKVRIFTQTAYTPDLPGIVFDVVRSGQVTAQRIGVTSYETDRLDLKAVLEAPAWASIQSLPRKPGQSTQELVLEARIKADVPKGLNTGMVHLLTTAANQPDLVIPIQARVFDTVSVSPIPATLKPAKVGEARELELEYHALDGKVLELDSVTETTGAIEHLRGTSCGVACVKVTGRFVPTRVGEFGGGVHAKFKRRAETVSVGWDVLVLDKNATIHDLGVLGGRSERAIDVDGSTSGGDLP